MNLKNKELGFIFYGNYNLINKVISEIEKNMTCKNISITSIIDTKNMNEEIIKQIRKISKNKVYFICDSKIDWEFVKNLDILILVPCRGDIIYKIANNILENNNFNTINIIYSFLNNDKPIVLAIDSKDILSSNAENIGKLLIRKNCFFIPFKQYNPLTEPFSMRFDYTYIIKTIEYALRKIQIQPIIISL